MNAITARWCRGWLSVGRRLQPGGGGLARFWTVESRRSTISLEFELPFGHLSLQKRIMFRKYIQTSPVSSEPINFHSMHRIRGAPQTVSVRKNVYQTIRFLWLRCTAGLNTKKKSCGRFWNYALWCKATHSKEIWNRYLKSIHHFYFWLLIFLLKT